MANKLYSYIKLVVSFYPLFLIASFFALTVLPKEFARNPWLIDRKWKRVLWVVSCLFFVPFMVIFFTIPRFIFSEIRGFITGAEDTGNKKGRNINDR
jgi:hypothetical protein